MHADHSAATHLLLTSPLFRRCRDEAERIERDIPSVERLLHQATSHVFAAGSLIEAGGGLEFDEVCQSIEADLDADPRTLNLARRTRFRLRLAALLYVTARLDLIPESWLQGYVDDLTVVRWANRLTG